MSNREVFMSDKDKRNYMKNKEFLTFTKSKNNIFRSEIVHVNVNDVKNKYIELIEGGEKKRYHPKYEKNLQDAILNVEAHLSSERPIYQNNFAKMRDIF